MNDPDKVPTVAAPSPQLLENLQRVLAHEIPISAALGIRPLRYDGMELTLGAPLQPNINHKQTAFGGSLYCAAVLAGWALLHLRLRPHLDAAGVAAHIVIQQADIDYRRPVSTDFEAMCRWPPTLEESRLLRMLKRHGRARVQLEARIGVESDPLVRFTGRYVVHTGAAFGHAAGA